MTQQYEYTSLLDMLHSARWLATYTLELTRAQFLTTRAHQNAVLFEIVRFSEAVNRLPSQFRASYPAFPWGKVRGFRNRIVHEYDRIDYDIAWDTATQDIPSLLPIIEAMIERHLPELDPDA